MGGTAMKRLINAAAVLGLLVAAPVTVLADEPPMLPGSVLFATSTGYWEGEASLPESAPPTPAPPVSSQPALPAARHGYYKLYAVRQPDATSRVYLQQIAASDDGPQVLNTVELSEITALKCYVTDIRPENSSGLIKEPGLFASVILKTTPDGETQSWTVLIDELGEITVEPASN
jgi:hypothetical protein